MRKTIEAVRRTLDRKVIQVSGVYGLVDRDTNIIRYVGSSTDIALRFYAHLHSRKSGKRTLREVWLKDAVSIGRDPTCVVLEEIPLDLMTTEHRHKTEALWIKRLFDEGQADLNARLTPALGETSWTLRQENKRLREENARLILQIESIKAVCLQTFTHSEGD